MPITLSKDTEKLLVKSIRRYFDENMEQGIGELPATLLLDFIVREIGPNIYNQAIADAQAVMQEKIGDLDGTCHLPEFGYWAKNTPVRRPR